MVWLGKVASQRSRYLSLKIGSASAHTISVGNFSSALSWSARSVKNWRAPMISPGSAAQAWRRSGVGIASR